MGIDIRNAVLVSAVKSLGGDLSRSATIGRLSLLSDAESFGPIYALHGITPPPHSEFCEPFLTALGAQSVDSFDVSDYQEATHLHDMNEPLPAKWKGQYSLVVDGGTIEHVFNAPQALKNCMELVAVGGHFLMSVPGNNMLGHGFWQFSPELAHRVFAPANGFEIVAVLLQELPRPFWKDVVAPYMLVRDPAEIGERAELVNSNPTMLHVIARKVAEVDIFTTAPQQSDYVPLWERQGKAPPRAGLHVRIARKVLPGAAKRILKPTYPRRTYTRLTADAVMRGKLSS